MSKLSTLLSFALPYDQQDYDFVGIEPANLGTMENLTLRPPAYQRSKGALSYFRQSREQTSAQRGSEDLFTIKLKAKRKVTFNLKAVDGILVDKNLNMQKF